MNSRGSNFYGLELFIDMFEGLSFEYFGHSYFLITITKLIHGMLILVLMQNE